MTAMKKNRQRKLPSALLNGGVLLVIAATGLSSCSSAIRPPPPAREITSQESRLLHDAEQNLIRACMTRQGLGYWLVSEDPLPEYRDFPYVVDDVAWAAKHGYGDDLRRRMQELSESHPNRRHFATLSARQRQVWITSLHGGQDGGLEARLPSGGILHHSATGCTSEAERRLYGDLATWYRVKYVVNDLVNERRRRVVADPAFTAATADWSRCMHRLGHQYADPADIRAHLNASKTSPKTQVRLAVAEATCATRTDLATTADELDRRYAKALAREDHTDTAAKSELELAAVPGARSVVSGS
jgi:hypothetical protein